MKTTQQLFLSFAFAVFLWSCSEDDTGGGMAIQPVDHQIEAKYDENYDNLEAENVSIQLTNSETGEITDVTTVASGIAPVTLTPGVYSLSASITLTPQEYEDLFGQIVEQNVSFNGSLSSVTINSATAGTTPVILETGRIGNLLISQVYHAGSDVVDGALFRDQFIEIHNNSNETIFLDGLCVSQLYGESRLRDPLESYHQPNGQLDWSKSINQTKGDASNTDYVYADEILRVPGTGESYPLESGQSAIIAATGINHKEPLVITNDEGEQETYEVNDPSLTVDLSGAMFEAYFADFVDNALEYDVDNPTVENMEVIMAANRDFLMDPQGRDAMVIFYANDETLSNWEGVVSPREDEVGDNTLYKQIPVAEIIDGVNLQHVNPSRFVPQRCVNAIDAGYKALNQGNYSSESLIRKVASTSGSRTFYQDTNNSTNDYEVITHPSVN